jgi:hypothetical protein
MGKQVALGTTESLTDVILEFLASLIFTVPSQQFLGATSM